MTMNRDSNANQLRRNEDSLAVLEPRSATNWRYRVSASLLELPRYVKRAILLVSDYLVSCLCLFLALFMVIG